MRRRSLLSNGEVPIMSFQTDLNGTFNPSFTLAAGTLKWIIDGEEQVTNTPSKVLTGATVNVEVFANDVVNGVNCSIATFETLGIIGELDFSYFTLTSTCTGNNNPGLTSLVFSSGANTIMSLQFVACAFTTVDLSNVTITGTCWLYSNSSLSSITFSNTSNTPTSLQLYSCAFTSLDLSNVVFNGLFYAYSNSGLSSIIFSSGANVATSFRLDSCAFTSLDLSDITLNGLAFIRDNSGLTSLTPSEWGTAMTFFIARNCALNLASVDGLYESLDTYMSANAPTADLTVQTQGGTNATPTGGSYNENIVHLRDTVYPGETQTFTATINEVDTQNPVGTATGTYVENTFTYPSTIDAGLYPSLDGKYAYDTGFTEMPIVFMGHGWSGDKDEMTQADLRRWAARGYFAVSLGLRGSGGVAAKRDASARELYDIYDGLNYLKGLFSQITDKHVWTGYSGGGGNGFGLASKFPDTFVVVAPFFGMSDYGYDNPDGWYYSNTLWQTSISDTIGDTPANVPNDYRARYHVESVWNNFLEGFLMMFHDPGDTIVDVVHSDNVKDIFDLNSKTNYEFDRDAKWTHGNPTTNPDLADAEPSISAKALSRNIWEVADSGTMIVNGYIITQKFSIWLGDGVTEAENGWNRTATVVYDTTIDEYDVTPIFETGATQTRVIITQGAKSANQIITGQTLIEVT